MKNIDKNEKGFGTVEAILILIIVMLIGVVGWMVYKNHHKTTALSAASTASTSQSKANTSKVTATKQRTVAPASTTTVFQIPQLGVEITVPNSIKDVVYKVDPDSTLSTGQQTQTVTLSTQTLTNLDSDCSVNGSAPPLGTLSKTTGQYPSDPDVDSNNASGGLVKQFSSYYIAWGNPQAACGSAMSTQNEAGTDTDLFKTALFSTVAPI